jgi:hypothetical protein
VILHLGLGGLLSVARKTAPKVSLKFLRNLLEGDAPLLPSYQIDIRNGINDIQGHSQRPLVERGLSLTRII